MPTMTTVEKTKTAGFVARGSNYARKQSRMEAEEAEIARLEAEARGETFEEPAVETPEEPVGEVTTGVTEAPQNLEEEEEDLSPEEKSFKKRYGDLRRHMQNKEKEWEEKFKALENAGTKTSIRPPKSDEDIETWASKYPDVAAIVETIATKKAQEMFSKADTRLQELDEIARKTEVSKAENQIRKAHGDFDDLRASDEFHDWAGEQPKWVQDALYENMDDPASVIRVIDLYKVDKGLTNTAKREQSKAAARDVPARSKTKVETDGGETVRESQVAKMSDKEYEANEDKILKAMREGRFIYDISGAAR